MSPRAAAALGVVGLASVLAGAPPGAALDARNSDLPAGRGPSPGASAAGGVVFWPGKRAISNWQSEANGNLDPSAAAKARLDGDSEGASIPRCVKLNNYWCIKRARRAGNIAADPDGHVAFASAFDGAVAAAELLRRYYLDYGRHSAMAILSHWAPAQCSGEQAAIAKSGKHPYAKLAGLAKIAPFGIQNTLRARWLAAHRRGSMALGTGEAVHPSAVRRAPLMMIRVPAIAAGMGEPDRPLLALAALEFAAPATTAPAGPPSQSCPREEMRIRSYAFRAIEGIAVTPEEDLALFAADGLPSPNARRFLENMARVEIGPLAARAELIAAAVGRLTARNE